MKKTFLVCLIFIFYAQAKAQEEGASAPPAAEPSVGSTTNNSNKLQKPMTRGKSTTGVNSESSSFIGDPDNIDPLAPNRENLKEDEEPVLEDIKQVLNAPKKKSPEKPATTGTATIPTTESAPVTETPTDSTGEAAVAETPKQEKKNLNPDGPDLGLEKKFNRIYRAYNINPTPDDVWAAATSKQTLREYIVQKGDTLWSISKILFDDPNFWPKIWALNKQGILNPHFIIPKAKIYFYMGDEVSAPTLSVGTLSESPLPAAPGQAPPSDGKTIAGRSDIVSKIPDSLPLYRNQDYFGEPKKGEIRIELGSMPRFDYEGVNDIYITDKVVKTEVKVQIDETARFRCYEGRILRDIKYVGKLVEDYDVFEPLDSFKTAAGTMYAYRTYGKANPYLRKNLKLHNCRGLLTTDLIIIPKDKIQILRNKQLTTTKKAILIGGPQVVKQKLFASNQVAYVDFGTYSFEAGQEYKTMSQVTDEINGQIKIIEKYGSFAVVLVTDVDDVIAIGDTVVLK